MNANPVNPYIMVLGIAQDAGYPHIGCHKECCKQYYDGKQPKYLVSSLALIDPVSKQRWIFDCTPDFPAQLHLLDTIFPVDGKALDGIFLTHAHIGHYSGLIYLGRESLNTKDIPVYGEQDMLDFLKNNGPWSQLVKLKNIDLQTIKCDNPFSLNERLSVTAFSVPHRGEYTSTVGYKISGGGKNVIFIPDIDKWTKWDRDIVEIAKENDFLFLDATFFRNGEIKGREMADIPHPFIEESMETFKGLSPKDKAKIHFIHLNHTNPALLHNSAARKEIQEAGYYVAEEGEIFEL